MNSQNNIEDELRGLNSDLPFNNNHGPFSVPEGYFEGLAGSILAKVKKEQPVTAREEIESLSPLLAGISRTMPYDVPVHYFESGIEQLPILTSENEESLILSFIDKSMPYEVPLGYFAGFPDKVLERIAPPAKVRVIPVISRKWMRMAVAAMVAGIVSISGFFYLTGNTHTNSIDTDAAIAREVKSFSTPELDDFIKSSDVNLIHSETAKNKSAKADVQQMLQGVSEKDVDAFLKQVPNEDDLAL